MEMRWPQGGGRSGKEGSSRAEDEGHPVSQGRVEKDELTKGPGAERQDNTCANRSAWRQGGREATGTGGQRQLRASRTGTRKGRRSGGGGSGARGRPGPSQRDPERRRLPGQRESPRSYYFPPPYAASQASRILECSFHIFLPKKLDIQLG